MTERYAFSAIGRDGSLVRGCRSAVTVDEVRKSLRDQGYVVVGISSENRARRLWTVLNSDLTLRRKLSAKELVGLAGEWGHLLSAGVVLHRVLTLSMEQSRPSHLRALLHDIETKVRSGSSLHNALNSNSGVVPLFFIAIVGAGEQAAALGPSLLQFAEDARARSQLTEEVRNALLYPIFLLVTACAAIAVLLSVVVPNLESLFGAKGLSAAPAVTRMVIGVSHFFRDKGYIFISGFVATVAGLIITCFSQAGRRKLGEIILRVPWVGPTSRLFNTARLLRSMFQLLSAGVPLVSAVSLSVPSVSNPAMRQKLSSVQASIRTGHSLSRALEEAKQVTTEAIVLIRTGEETGQLGALIGQASALCELRARARLRLVSTLIGPAFTAIFGVVAGLIVYAIMTTILSINGLAFQ